MGKNYYDVIISGAGPSGSLLGYLLSIKNINTLILEKEQFPRYKVCAGGIQWKAMKLFPYGIEEIIQRKIYGIYFSRKLKDIFHKRYSEPLMYTVDRAELDDFMARKAISSGCAINFNERIKDFELKENAVKIFTGNNTYFAKILVGADGANSIIFKKSNTREKVKKIIGYEAEVPSKNLNLNCFNGNNLMLDFGGIRKGYTWIFPKKSYLSIGDGGPVQNAVKIKEYLLWFLKNYESVLSRDDIFKKQSLPREPKIRYDIRAHLIPVRNGNAFLCFDRILTVGDAAGLCDGFTGEGLYNAMLSSHIASDSISDALKYSNFKFRDYFKKINNEIYKNIKNSIIISKIFFPSLLFYYKLIKNNDNLFNSCAKILRGEKTYSQVVNKLKLIRI
ncbi:MAG: geranylgeranyl reductase family protein [Actinomycetota bacterium]|nr:geranylgeranyl reductase family protein [Actinomycetota bacterium]